MEKLLGLVIVQSMADLRSSIFERQRTSEIPTGREIHLYDGELWRPLSITRLASYSNWLFFQRYF